MSAPDAERAALLVQQALPAFGIGGAAAIEFVNHRENHVFRVRAAGRDLAVKLHRRALRRDEEIESESMMLAALARAGLPVATPLTAAGGGHRVLVAEPGQATPRQVTAQQWVADATALGDSAAIFEGRAGIDPGLLHQLGVVMARIHRHAQTVGAPPGYRRRAWDAAGLAGPEARWGRASELPVLEQTQRALVLEAERRVAVALSDLDKHRGVFGPIHADLTAENVLLADGELVLIDFDDSGPGWYLFDLATAYFFWTGNPEARTMLDALVAGYRTQRVLDPAELRGWHPLLLARALSYLAWSIGRSGHPVSEYHERVLLPWILPACERYIACGDPGWGAPAGTPGPAATARRGAI